jgi:hypothetical protein
MGIKINEFKTKEMKVSPSTDLVLTINGSNVKEPFTYLGSIVSIRCWSLRGCPQSYQEGKWGLHGVVPSLEELTVL